MAVFTASFTTSITALIVDRAAINPSPFSDKSTILKLFFCISNINSACSFVISWEANNF